MLQKLFLTFSLLAFAQANFTKPPDLEAQNQERTSTPTPFAYPSYKFSYGVQDSTTGDFKNQKEIRDGDVVEGEYSVVGPDGVVQTVSYVVDSVKGIRAVVNKDEVATGLEKELFGPGGVEVVLKGKKLVGGYEGKFREEKDGKKGFEQSLDETKFGGREDFGSKNGTVGEAVEDFDEVFKQMGEVEDVLRPIVKSKGGEEDFALNFDQEKVGSRGAIKSEDFRSVEEGEDFIVDSGRSLDKIEPREEIDELFSEFGQNLGGKRFEVPTKVVGGNLQEVVKSGRGKPFKEQYLGNFEFVQNFGKDENDFGSKPVSFFVEHLENSQKDFKRGNLKEENLQGKFGSERERNLVKAQSLNSFPVKVESLINEENKERNVGKAIIDFRQDGNLGKVEKSSRQKVLDYLHEEYEKTLRNVENYNFPYYQQEEVLPQENQVTKKKVEAEKSKVFANSDKGVTVENYVAPKQSLSKQDETQNSKVEDGNKFGESWNVLEKAKDFKEAQKFAVEEESFGFSTVPTIQKTRGFLKSNRNQENFQKGKKIYNFDEYYNFPLYQGFGKVEEKLVEPETKLEPIQKVLNFLQQEKSRKPINFKEEKSHQNQQHLPRENVVVSSNLQNFESYATPEVQQSKSSYKTQNSKISTKTYVGIDLGDGNGGWIANYDFDSLSPKTKNEEEQISTIKNKTKKKIKPPKILQEIMNDYNQNFPKPHVGLNFDQHLREVSSSPPPIKQVGSVDEAPKIDYHIQRHFAQQMKAKFEQERRKEVEETPRKKDRGLNQGVHQGGKGFGRHKNIVQENLKVVEDSGTVKGIFGLNEVKEGTKGTSNGGKPLKVSGINVKIQESFKNLGGKSGVANFRGNLRMNFSSKSKEVQDERGKSYKIVEVNDGNSRKNLHGNSDVTKFKQNLRSNLRKVEEKSMENQIQGDKSYQNFDINLKKHGSLRKNLENPSVSNSRQNARKNYSFRKVVEKSGENQFEDLKNFEVKVENREDPRKLLENHDGNSRFLKNEQTLRKNYSLRKPVEKSMEDSFEGGKTYQNIDSNVENRGNSRKILENFDGNLGVRKTGKNLRKANSWRKAVEKLMEDQSQGEKMNQNVENYEDFKKKLENRDLKAEGGKLKENYSLRKILEESMADQFQVGKFEETVADSKKNFENRERKISRRRKSKQKENEESMENENYPREFIENRENYSKMLPRKIVKYVNGKQIFSENEMSHAKKLTKTKAKFPVESLRISSQTPEHATSYITYHRGPRRQEKPKHVNLPNYPVEMLAFIYPEEFPENHKVVGQTAKSSRRGGPRSKKPRPNQNSDSYNPAESISRVLNDSSEELTEDKVMEYIKDFDAHFMK